MKLEPLTNATVVDDVIKFVAFNKIQKIGRPKASDIVDKRIIDDIQRF